MPEPSATPEQSPLSPSVRGDGAAFAANWRTVLAVDVGIGLALTGGGVAVAVVAGAWGWVVVVAGAIELFFAGGRVTKWRRLRRQAGL